MSDSILFTKRQLRSKGYSWKQIAALPVAGTVRCPGRGRPAKGYACPPSGAPRGQVVAKEAETAIDAAPTPGACIWVDDDDEIAEAA
jgi:hypothetical protein